MNSYYVQLESLKYFYLPCENGLSVWKLVTGFAPVKIFKFKIKSNDNRNHITVIRNPILQPNSNFNFD